MKIMNRVTFKSVFSVIAFFLFLDYVSYDGRFLITHFEHLWHDKKDICEVRLPSEHLVIDLNTSRSSVKKARASWVMPNINLYYSSRVLQELVVVEVGSAVSHPGKVMYVKSGGIVGSNNDESVERIFYEEGAVLYLDTSIPKTRCGEIKVLNTLPSNPKFPDQRTVDVRGPDITNRPVLEFENRQVINNQVLMIPESDNSLCIDHFFWVAEGLFAHGRGHSYNFRAKVRLIDPNGGVLDEVQISFYHELIDRFPRYLRFDKESMTFRNQQKASCLNGASEPGAHKIQVHLDAFNDIEETDETNNIFSYNFDIVN